MVLAYPHHPGKWPLNEYRQQSNLKCLLEEHLAPVTASVHTCNECVLWVC